jgi:Txe/YoeB family toxin of Txe-Axe toxin-antitoxin module
METVFLRDFSKDIDKINQKSIKQKVAKLISTVEKATALSDIPKLKKLVGH